MLSLSVSTLQDYKPSIDRIHLEDRSRFCLVLIIGVWSWQAISKPTLKSISYCILELYTTLVYHQDSCFCINKSIKDSFHFSRFWIWIFLSFNFLFGGIKCVMKIDFDVILANSLSLRHVVTLCGYFLFLYI